MKQTVRTFVAVEAGTVAREEAAALIDQLQRSGADVKWVRPENLHLTLKFLGEVASDRLAEVCEAVQSATSQVPAFDFGLRGVGAFPRIQRPRTIWLGCREGEKAMSELAHRVDKALQQLRFPRESRRFEAHLTLGRVRGPSPGLAALSALLPVQAAVQLAPFRVEEAVIFTSDLRPSGPVYTPVGRAALSAG